MAPSRFLTLAAAAAVVAVTAACSPPRPECAICRMPVPAETAVLVSIDGGPPQLVCDARCPLTMQDQTERSAALLQVTDFESEIALDPATAFFVTGSDTAPDAHTTAVRTTPGETAYLHWHRCLPSVLAFATRDAAERFQREHGGVVMTLDDLGFEGRPSD